MKIIVIAAIGLAVSGCATVTRGTSNNVQIKSEPSGAKAMLSTGQHCPSTPCTFDIPRKTEFTVSYEMPGYMPQQVDVKTQLAGAGAAGFAGNVLVGGLIGMGVDAATGSTLEHVPNPVVAYLQPAGKPAAAAKRVRKPKPAPAPAAAVPQS